MPYRPQRSTLTRQLTADEEALEKRASSFIQAPNPAQTFESEQGRYAWMERDLRMRDMQARALQQEAELAGGFGDKRAIAALDTKETEEDVMAQKGLDLVAKKVASGINFDRARLEASTELGLDLNEGFHTRANDRSKIYETPQSRATRERKELIERLELGKKEFESDVALKAVEGDDRAAQAIRTQRAIYDANEIKANVNRTAAQIEDLDDDRRYGQAERNSKDWITYGDGTPLGRAKAAAAFGKVGLGGIENKERFIKEFSTPENEFVLQALADEDFMKKRFSDDPKDTPDGLTGKEKIANFSNIINDYQADPPDQAKDPIAYKAWAKNRAKAEQSLFEFAGDHVSEKEQSILRRDRRKAEADITKALEVANKVTADALGKATAENMDALSMKFAGIDAPADMKVNTIAANARAFLASSFAMNPGDRTIYDKAKQELDDMVNPNPVKDKDGNIIKHNYLKDPAKANNEASKIMARYIYDQNSKRISDRPSDTTPPPADTTTTTQTTPPATTTQTAARDKNADAIEWLKQNPDHPSAPAIRAKLGIKP